MKYILCDMYNAVDKKWAFWWWRPWDSLFFKFHHRFCQERKDDA